MGTGLYPGASDAARTGAGRRAAPRRGYIARPIPVGGRRVQHRRMTNLGSTIVPAQPSSGPPTEHPAEILSWTRRLSDSAESIVTAAASPGAAAAIVSALADIETALEYLERGTEEMEARARARLSQATVLLGDPWNDDLVARTAHDFDDLGRALANARRSCEKVRRSAGPILAELTAI